MKILSRVALSSALLFASLPAMPVFADTTCQTIGNDTFCHNSDGTTTVCQRIGDAEFCSTH